MKHLAALAVIVGALVYLHFGTLSPCGMLRENVRQHDNLASIIPDSVVDLALSARYGPLTPSRCLDILLSSAPSATSQTAQQPTVQPPAQQQHAQQPPAQQQQASRAPVAGEEAIRAAFKETETAMTECRARRLNGELKTYLASVRCSNPRIMQAFSAANYRHMDLIALMTAKRLQVAEKVDRNELTEIDAQVEYTKIWTEIIEAERRRDNAGAH